ncbi:hypothetical protein N7451_012191 [Penicillium sp. IBT 35674x]|nr:hypothetical protein N7451_012191 [Penicillium sp. IBT 35674x]
MSDPLSLISSNHFHRRVILDTAYGPLTITFADIGCATGPALLFLPGMFASRYFGVPLHVIAERAGVRLLVVDRPGMGASPSGSICSRACWPISAFQASVLSRTVPVLFTCSTPGRSAVRFDADGTASPVLASSGTLIRRISPRSSNEAAEDLSFPDANWRRVERDYGVPHSEQAKLARLALRFMYAENTVGANSEALQCLRKSDGSSWGPARTMLAVRKRWLPTNGPQMEESVSVHTLPPRMLWWAAGGKGTDLSWYWTGQRKD